MTFDQRLYIQYPEDDSGSFLRGIKEFGAEWGWHKPWFNCRILIVEFKSPFWASVEAEMTTHWLADSVDDFLAARVYFGGNISTDLIERVLRTIPFTEHVVGLNIRIDRPEGDANPYRLDTPLTGDFENIRFKGEAWKQKWRMDRRERIDLD